MAGLQIEGDLSNISDIQLDYIRNVLEKKLYKDNKIVIEPVGKAGDNYVANVKRIIAQDANGTPTLKLIAKIAPQNEMARVMGKTGELFRNEHLMYTKILPKFTSVEEAADIPPRERLRYAACHGSFTDAPHEVILLEDLVVSNFVMLDRMKPITNDCIMSVLKNFAKLHSISYALKKNEPEVYDEFKNSLFDMWSVLDKDENTKLYFANLEDTAAKILESDKYRSVVKGSISNLIPTFSKLARADKDSKHSVIQQGDSWTNNIMFKFDGETLQESIMIDYQISKSSNPVCDILYLILNCSDYQMRKEHFLEWIDFYHSELDKALSNYGIKAMYVYPRDQLDADLKRYGRMSFGQSIMIANVLSLSSDEAKVMKDAMEKASPDDIMNMSQEMFASNSPTAALIKVKIEGLVDSCKELGLL